MQAHASLLNRRPVERLRQAHQQRIGAAAIVPLHDRRWGADPHAAAPPAATPRRVTRANLAPTTAKKKGSSHRRGRRRVTPCVLLQRIQQNAAGRATCASTAPACRTPTRAASSNVSLAGISADSYLHAADVGGPVSSATKNALRCGVCVVCQPSDQPSPVIRSPPPAHRNS